MSADFRAISPALLAAFGYTLSTLFLKSALGRGASAGTVNAWSNLALGIVAAPVLLLDDPGVPNPDVMFPILTACIFFVGQLFTFAALEKGDVSVATPVLGLKVLLVTVMNALIFSVPVPGRWWMAAVLASLGIVLIAARPPARKGREVWTTGLLAFLAASAFSLTDVLVQQWAGRADPFVYLPVMFAAVSVVSTFFYLISGPRAFRIRRESAVPLIIGALLLGIQAALMFFALAWSGDATAVNVLYASRSLLTVLAAWTVGKWFLLAEAKQSRSVLAMRLVAAVMLFAAIVLVC